MSITKIVVAGAGYAGVMSALRLAGKTRQLPVDVTLINAADRFMERPRLHEAAAGRALQGRPIAQMLQGSRVRFQKGIVRSLEPDRRKLALDTEGGSQEVTYDHLIYALGSRVDDTSVPGVREHAYRLDATGPRSVQPLYRRLCALTRENGRVVVVGSGATGIEVAAEIADTFPKAQVSIVTRGAFGAFKGGRVQKYMREAMARLGVGVVEYASVKAVRANGLTIIGGPAIPFDVCVWAGGFRANSLGRRAGLDVNERDQILVDACLRSVSHPDIYAVGDAAQPLRRPGAPMRMALFTALVTGAHAADNLNRLLRGEPQQPLAFSYYGQGIALGRRDAVAFASYPDDEPVGPMYTGRFALTVRNFFVWLILRLLTIERWWPGFFFWLGKSRARELDGREETVSYV